MNAVKMENAFALKKSANVAVQLLLANVTIVAHAKTAVRLAVD